MADFDTDLLIGGEENCWPDPTQACHPNTTEQNYIDLRAVHAVDHVGMVRAAPESGPVSGALRIRPSYSNTSLCGA